MRLPISLILVLIILPPGSSIAAIDSTKHKGRTFVVTPRFNTLNMAPISGNIVNRHFNLDITTLYTKKRFTWATVTGIDLEDGRSEMNYFLTNVRYKINLSKKFAISPFLAFYSEHAYQLVDPISDANAGMLFSYRRAPLAIEAFVLVVRLTHPPVQKDVIYRLEIRYDFKFVTFSGFLYQNADYFDNKQRLAVGFRALLPMFKILDKLSARSEVTGSFRIEENPKTPNLNGIFLSLAFPLDI